MPKRLCRYRDNFFILSIIIVMFAATATVSFPVAKAFLQTFSRGAGRHSRGVRAFQLSSQRNAAAPRWQVGDSVLVPQSLGSPSETVKGVIQEERGSGWYEIVLEGEDERVIKCRGSQLRSLTTKVDATTTIENPVSAAVVSPILTSNAGGQVGVAPPPPTIIDLDATIAQQASDPVKNLKDRAYFDQVAHHMTYKRWVVFTDLHCSPSTLPTTLEVLDQVHELARQREAGVLFLGDWWHHRGSIRVDCLNAVLASLKKWTVPMIMIPGNHDQVTLGGHNHGLTPLENSYRVYADPQDANRNSFPGPLVFSHPTKFANALFVPHIRYNAIMESVLQSKQAMDAAALFVHADVTGAYMNDMIMSLGGVPPAMFPPNKPIYSGHFHKPHVVATKRRDVSIEYLGSPYQVSLAEAQQDKALAVLDADDGWKCVERIPLRIGRKHFRVTSLDEFLSVRPSSLKTKSALPDGELVANVDDRVVLTLEKQWMDDYKFSSTIGETSELESHAQALRAAGINVEIREAKEVDLDPTAMGASTNANLEEMSLESTWKAFLAEEVRREAVSSTIADQLRKAGLEILEEIESNSEELGSDRRLGPMDVQLHSVTVEGFGPFCERATYPLSNRGLVLLRGTNRDGGSDSNGSGKTSLAMSTLWALTGTIDSRPLQDNKVADVINESCKTARAVVQGTLNGVEFSITRTKTKSRGNLIFVYDGEDLTTQSVKETQVLIDEKLGTSPQILSRTLFHGQHALNGLLEATDTKFKEELSLVVPIEKWQDAASRARKLSRTATKHSAELDGMIAVRSGDLREALGQLEKEGMLVKERESSVKEALSTYEGEILRLEKLEYSGADNDESLEELQANLAEVEAARKKLESDCKGPREAREKELQPMQNHLVELEVAFDEATADVHDIGRDLDECVSKLQSSQSMISNLENMWEVDLSSGIPATFELPIKCPTCKQSLTDQGVGHDHDDLEKSVLREITITFEHLDEARNNVAEKSKKLKNAEEVKVDTIAKLTAAREELFERTQHWDNIFGDLDEEKEKNRRQQEHVSALLGQAAVQLQRQAEVESLKANLKSEEERLRSSRAAFAKISDDVKKYENRLADLRVEKDEQERIAVIMSNLAQAFAHKGVQTFVLQHAVTSLQATAQSFLTELSDGAQRLEMTLDSGDGIARRAFVRGKGGEYSERPLGSLSGGQWRRCSLALNFGFADLVARRGNFRSSLCILDEPLTHLDQAGRADVGRVLRGMLRRTPEGGLGLSFSTILIILQDLAAEELEEAFDYIDEVVKSDGASIVLVDGEVAE